MYRILFSLLMSLMLTSAAAATFPFVWNQTTTVTAVDSLKHPVATEQKQHRADKRADLEEMKRRYRGYQEKMATRQAEAQWVAEEQDYLWSEAESSALATVSPAVATAPVVQPEELRMEISRNLQSGRTSSPHTPENYQQPSYDAPAFPTSYALTVKSPEATSREVSEVMQLSFRQSSATITAPKSGLPLQVGEIILLDEVTFAPGNAQIYPEAATPLTQWATLLRENPELTVEVRAYTSGSAGDAPQAMTLSRERAENVATYWQQLGVSKAQVSYRGYGQIAPLVPADVFDAAQKNERIELIILELPTR